MKRGSEDRRDRIRRIFLESLNIDVPTFDTDLIDAGLLDSLGLVELLVGLEQEFGVTIPLDELEIDRLRTIDSISDLIERCSRGI